MNIMFSSRSYEEEEGRMTENLTIEEFAKNMKVSVSTVRRWIKLGMPVYQPGGVGGLIRIPASKAGEWAMGRGGND